jgi:hypothetical protein
MYIEGLQCMGADAEAVGQPRAPEPGVWSRRLIGFLGWSTHGFGNETTTTSNVAGKTKILKHRKACLVIDIS